ncbi:MAG TPA: GH116 family glycosyl hydrolase, partial [Mucilaginibacter sp.]
MKKNSGRRDFIKNVGVGSTIAFIPLNILSVADNKKSTPARDTHLNAVYKYNFKEDLSEHANPQRPSYALGNEAGLLLCTWPKGGKLSLPFVYSDEVWTGIEHQVASHLILAGNVQEGLKILRASRDR